MSEPRLKTRIWVQGQIRLCDLNCIPAAVLYRGDPDAGAVLLKLRRGDDGWMVLSQTRDEDGRPAWIAGLGGEIADEAAADAYIERQRRYDPDLWVVEIDDRRAAYEPDAPLLRNP